MSQHDCCQRICCQVSRNDAGVLGPGATGAGFEWNDKVLPLSPSWAESRGRRARAEREPTLLVLSTVAYIMSSLLDL